MSCSKYVTIQNDKAPIFNDGSTDDSTGGAQFGYPCNYPFWNEEKNGENDKKKLQAQIRTFLTM